jgi:hypothetical protein
MNIDFFKNYSGDKKKLTEVFFLNPDGLIEDFEYFIYPEKFTLKNQGEDSAEARLRLDHEEGFLGDRGHVQNFEKFKNPDIYTQSKITSIDSNNQNSFHKDVTTDEEEMLNNKNENNYFNEIARSNWDNPEKIIQEFKKEIGRKNYQMYEQFIQKEKKQLIAKFEKSCKFQETPYV